MSTLTNLFSDIADAIRAKTGSSASITASDFPTAIGAIPTGSQDQVYTNTGGTAYAIAGTKTFQMVDGNGHNHAYLSIPYTDVGFLPDLIVASSRSQRLNETIWFDGLYVIRQSADPFAMFQSYSSAPVNFEIPLIFSNIPTGDTGWDVWFVKKA